MSNFTKSLNRLWLLSDLQLYSRIHVPHAVYDEIVTQGAGRAGAAEAAAADRISTSAATDRVLVSALESGLDPGETEAIAPAVDMSAGIVVTDERRGRRVAARLGPRPLGTVGVLLDAKQYKIVDEVVGLPDAFPTVAGSRIGPALYPDARRRGGE